MSALFGISLSLLIKLRASLLGASACLRRGPANHQFLRCRGRNQRRHLADHGQHQPLVSVGERGAETLDFGQEADFVLRKLPQHLLRFAVARRLRAREKVRERDVHGLRNLGECFQRRHGVPVFNPREVAAQKSGAALDVSLRQPPLAAIGLDDFSDVYAWLFFWHDGSPSGGSSLVANSRRSKTESAGHGSNLTMPHFAPGKPSWLSSRASPRPPLPGLIAAHQ